MERVLEQMNLSIQNLPILCKMTTVTKGKYRCFIVIAIFRQKYAAHKDSQMITKWKSWSDPHVTSSSTNVCYMLHASCKLTHAFIVILESKTVHPLRYLQKEQIDGQFGKQEIDVDPAWGGKNNDKAHVKNHKTKLRKSKRESFSTIWKTQRLARSQSRGAP